jgi:hypothetical protein
MTHLDDVANTTQNNAAAFLPIAEATVVAFGQTDMGKAIKQGIDKFSEGIPVLMSALDELKSLHPFIGGALILRCALYRK